jgi:uncharacterized membrane protein YgdD (TMEM256/DUF423 family)
MWLIIAGLAGATGVLAGAFGAHGLESRVPETDLAAFETGALYHLVHAAALFGVALLARGSGQLESGKASSPAVPGTVRVAGWLFLAGTILFSGSLYFLGLTGSRALVLVTPAGGLCFVGGWLALAWAGWRAR